ncbi:MAG: chromosome segregation protein SMC [Candidatus Binatia bacterium]
MRIKQLELIGFKSFVRRTVLDFPPGVTAIVGPNGCGKSNVVDAIRWVLGEQSPKHLRGSSMEDVIFNGNERVPQTGMAQVSLTFENDPAGPRPSSLDLDVSTVPAHFRALSEIMVTRRYFRSGESEYFINRTPCRLKDITELFLGTGVGTKAYAIIEQGRVEQLINAKPEDRRLFIEEAAGTTLYRSRKVAAERKMERTRDNLLRVEDVLREVDRQIQYLHRMAKKAEQYRSLQNEIRELDVLLTGAQWRRLALVVTQMEAESSREHEREQQIAAELARLERERGQKLANAAAADEELARCREAAAVNESERQGLVERIELLSHEVAERERRMLRLQAESATLAEQDARIQTSLQQQERDRSECVQLLRFDEKALSNKEAALADARTALVAANGDLEAAKNALVDCVSKETECRNALATQTRRCLAARQRLEKLEADQADATERLAAVDQAVTARRAAIVELRERVCAAQGEKHAQAERLRGLAEERRSWERETSEAHSLVLQLRSRLESLEEIQRTYEGYQPGVRSILVDHPQEGVLAVVGDVIGIPQQHERALAAALGDRLQYVIVREEDDGLGAVTALRHRDSGRGSFIPLSPRRVRADGNGRPALNGNTRSLLDLVHVEEPYHRIAEALLDEVMLVPDLKTALALWRQNGVHVTMVTPEGDVIDASGVISGGSERPLKQELVSRRRHASELAAQLVAAEGRLDRAHAATHQLRLALEQQETALQEFDRDVHALTLELVAGEKDLERLEGERPRWLDRLDVARFEAGAVATEESESDTHAQRIAGELSVSATERQSLETALHVRRERATTAAAHLDGLGNDVTSIKVRVAERRQRLEAAVAASQHLRAQLAEIASRTSALAAELAETGREHAGLQAAVDEAGARHRAQDARRAAIERETAQARAALDVASAEVAAHDRCTQEMRDDLDILRDQRRQSEIALAEKRLRIEHLMQHVREKYGADLAQQPPVEEVENEDEALARLEGLREKLARIGEVNVGAIEELRELEERAQFLRTHKSDLERSLADLERTIQRLNRASRTKFAEAFAAVNDKFQSVLPRLFRGGEARLLLTDEHNLLDTGVEIAVRPPGKRLQAVSLLSGGEKALVAVSLIFSLFLTNPTPFCFLDEVDAPLDDANIGRFTNLVRGMSEHSQFIVITHNKRTMEAANVLYGVTMEEPGVSKVISVAMR